MEKDPKNNGYKAEQLFYESISSYQLFEDIKHERDLKKLYSWSMTSIDYLLITKQGIIPVQIKYRGTRRRENNAIKNFLNSVNQLPNLYDKPILFGVWLSRLEPFSDNKDLLTSYNIDCVDYYHDLNQLIEKGVRFIVEKLAAA